MTIKVFRAYWYPHKVWISCFFFYAVLFACSDPSQKIVQENDPIFHTTAPARLYFQNTRSHHYQLITQKASKIDRYYLKAVSRDQLFYPVIDNNWLAEEAYILLESKDSIQQNVAIQIDNIKLISLDFEDRKSQYEAIIAIARAVDAEQNCCFIGEAGKCLNIFNSEQAKTQFKIVVRDYLKLVERF
ncbi:MAG: hypothetical protein AAF849_23705 [Bacteroidota bacterium]